MSSPSPESPRPMSIPERRNRTWVWYVVAGAAALVVLGGVLIALAATRHKVDSPPAAAQSAKAAMSGSTVSSAASGAVTPASATPATTSAAVSAPTTTSAAVIPPAKHAPKKASAKKKKPKTAAPVGSVLPAGWSWVLRKNGGADYHTGQLKLKPGSVMIYATVMRTNHEPLSAMWRPSGSGYQTWWSVASAVNGQTHQYRLTVSNAGTYQFAVKCLPGASWALRVMWKKAG